MVAKAMDNKEAIRSMDKDKHKHKAMDSSTAASLHNKRTNIPTLATKLDPKHRYRLQSDQMATLKHPHRQQLRN
jgi:hypothetical protein